MPWKDPPTHDFRVERDFHWPAWKFDLHMNVLFDDLHRRFNTAPLFILDDVSFHRDVFEIAHRTWDRSEFYSELQKRRDERLRELVDMMTFISECSFDHFDHTMTLRQSGNYLDLVRCASLDTLVKFFTQFLGPDRQGKPFNIDEYLAYEKIRKSYGHIMPTGLSTDVPNHSCKDIGIDGDSDGDSEADLLNSQTQIYEPYRRRRKKAKRPCPADPHETEETSHRDKRQRGVIQDSSPDQIPVTDRAGLRRDVATQTDNPRTSTVAEKIPRPDISPRKGRNQRRKEVGKPRRRQDVPIPEVTSRTRTPRAASASKLSDRDIRALRRAKMRDDMESARN